MRALIISSLLILSALVYFSCEKEPPELTPISRVLPMDLPDSVCPGKDSLIYQENIKSAGIDVSIGKYVVSTPNGYIFPKGSNCYVFTFIQNHSANDANNVIVNNTNYGLFSPNYQDVDLLDSDGFETTCFETDLLGFGFAFRQDSYVIPDTNILQIFFQSNYITSNENDNVQSNNVRRASIAVID